MYNVFVPAFYCYMLKCADGSLYTGWTTDPARRLRQHQAGVASRYTRGRRPVSLVYVEAFASRRAAQRREHRLKQTRRDRKLALIASADRAATRTRTREHTAPYDGVERVDGGRTSLSETPREVEHG